jgi:exodeoxyribonuclease VIII
MNTTIQQPTPGIYEDVPFIDYLAWPCVNNSSLSYAARSLAHYRYAPEQATTDAMRLGSLVHCGRLEPAALHMRYAVMPDLAEGIRKPDGTEYSNVRATKEYKQRVADWQAQLGDRQPVTQDELDAMLGMVQAITLHDRARTWLCSPGQVELCVVWDDPDSGVRCKARIDKLAAQHDLLVDLKTTRDASEFEQAIARYSYRRQAAFYLDGWRDAVGASAYQFAIVAVEKVQPFGVRAAVMAPDAVQIGRDQYKELLCEIADARKSGDWPGYDSPDAWTLPGWYLARHQADPQLTLNGELLQCE